ncbi:Nif3-like dinuclear metal center hexameric protein [Actinosynnema sp. ALI-1.44]|uniref:Nif3-like dinuclear metal center hexameric protein n=1 Tax=Actinosynnema sp. ALI-1.44 TaxID=1933779 RepID=UPI00097BFCD0|nr:Nif3-like dinuclear metal center hexameric protein [Actinosynnema sp. ALI-1.44]ONI77273.1 Nif3-like dinuclear metal center hexameric protein [Actinosynnema sp. ALI-1.44]
MITVGRVVAALAAAYPPELAESWDAIGLVCGDPAEEVRRALFCVDPTESIVDEAVELGAQLVVAHHPLLLRGVHGVPASTPKGGIVHRLIRSGIALYCAHTNADSASPGVSDALAAAIGIVVRAPLSPKEQPHLGLGRIGDLPRPEPFSAFVQRVADALPETAWGVRAAGDPERLIRTVAVCGGAGDSLLGQATAAGADAYVTADLRHHVSGEHIDSAPHAPALVDVSHWASEWPWCDQAAGVVRAAFGGNVETHTSIRRTDPWTLRAAKTGRTAR